MLIIPYLVCASKSGTEMCTFYKGHTQDIVFCQRLQYDENGEKELFFCHIGSI